MLILQVVLGWLLFGMVSAMVIFEIVKRFPGSEIEQINFEMNRQNLFLAFVALGPITLIVFLAGLILGQPDE